jgi:hypothetical protein
VIDAEATPRRCCDAPSPGHAKARSVPQAAENPSFRTALGHQGLNDGPGLRIALLREASIAL